MTLTSIARLVEVRLHSLEITAFGPFAETVAVDFDELTSSGLFLLSGATGAGKTSILDAVCFALYGDVPGDRGSARRLRCDTAAPGVAPRVVLEFTVSGRRLRMTRSPQWVRPKKRGAGETTEQAHVVCEERQDAVWVPLSNRLDETGHLITHLLGMTMAQFCQVAMLPQGQFQGFLRSRSDERHALLQRLFATDRFARIEQWLREHARELGRTANQHRDHVHRVVTRIEETSGEPAPEESTELETWAQQRREAAIARPDEAQRQAAGARETAAAARDELARAQETHQLQQRAQSAHRALGLLEAQRPEHQRRRDEVEAARRASAVAPLLRLEAEARAALARAAEARSAAVIRVAAFDHDGLFSVIDPALDDATIETWLADLAQRIELRTVEIETLIPLADELDQLSTQHDDDSAACAALDRRAQDAVARAEELPAQLAAATAERDLARRQSDSVAGLAAQVADAERRLAARQRLDQRSARLAEAERVVSQAVDAVQQLKEDWLQLRELRINGIAAELAHELVAGDNCPVCGSSEHPQRASAAPDAPTVADEKQARVRVDDAEFTRTTAEAELRDLLVEIASLRESAGEAEPAELRAQLRDLASALKEAERGAATLHRREEAVERLAAELAETQTESAALAAEASAKRATLASLTARVNQLRGRLQEFSARHGGWSLAQARDEVTAAGAAVQEALRQIDRTRQARAAAEQAATELDAELSEHGFDTAAEAREALRDQRELAALTAQVDEFVRAETSTRATLESPEIQAALQSEPSDLAALARADQEAAAHLERCHGAEATARQRSERLHGLVTELEQALAAWRPVVAAHGVAAELASFVEGRSVDNALRMRLSAYVLAWRLAQVVAAGNERLGPMTDGRYLLEHTGRRGAKDTRGGLSLVVRDEWSGEARDPATLSGGETFVVSLALALGLADVVSREAGGTELDTLFVDEGFGSLDAETLDDVMDTLDALREGGRVVGVVSHVAEMRTRIPQQLVVAKSRSGSTVSLRHAQE